MYSKSRLLPQYVLTYVWYLCLNKKLFIIRDSASLYFLGIVCLQFVFQCFDIGSSGL